MIKGIGQNTHISLGQFINYEHHLQNEPKNCHRVDFDAVRFYPLNHLVLCVLAHAYCLGYFGFPNYEEYICEYLT